MRVYLDHNATSPVRPEAVEAILAALNHVGNPSSVHAEGRATKSVIEAARRAIAEGLNANPETLVFTSGGTEADNLALNSAIDSGCRTLLISDIEHEAVHEAALASGLEIIRIPVGSDGIVDFSWLKDQLSQWDKSKGKPFVSVMAANNETGVIQPIQDIALLVKDAGGLFLTDAVQIPGKAAFDFRQTGAHYAAISAHKLGGPQGVGALLVADDAPITRQIIGGGQEKNKRSGTENVAGITGFSAAFNASLSKGVKNKEIKELRDKLELSLQDVDGVRIWGQHAPRLNNTICLTAQGWPSETQVIAMDLEGFAVSAGAACSSGKVRRSRVLEAMGAKPEESETALRISLGWSTSQEDVQAFASAWLAGYERARRQRAAS